MSKEIILTGLRANGEMHLGNYLGAILPAVDMQHEKAGQYQLNMFVPDLHSFITPIDHSALYQNSLDNVKVFAAAGLDMDNDDTLVYRQSFIPAHSELTWILNCFAYFGELNRMTQFKDKSAGANEQISAGLFDYPVLMAADILLYGALWVPVGEDQRQHLELTRDISIRMNNKFGEMFTVPNEWQKQLDFTHRSGGVRIRSLRNPDKKMSKSVEDPAGTILLSDNPAEAGKKVISATTDSFSEIKFDMAERPGISNLLQMLALITKRPQEEINQQWQGKQSYGELKQAVASEVVKFLEDFQGKIAQVTEESIIAKLEKSEAQAINSSHEVLQKVQKAVGLRR